MKWNDFSNQQVTLYCTPVTGDRIRRSGGTWPAVLGIPADLAGHGGIEFDVPIDGHSIYYDDIVVGDMAVYSSCEEVLYFDQGISGDLNQDCRIDFGDRAILAIQWLRCNDPANTDCNGN